MNKSDFIRTENYNLKLKPTGTKKITEAINKKFNEKVIYKNKQCNHTHILLLKTRELQQYLNKKTKLDLTTPKTKLKRIDNQTIREKILSISYTEWMKKDIAKVVYFI